MDGRRGKVLCHLHKGGNLKQEMKQEYWVGLYTWQRAEGRELSQVCGEQKSLLHLTRK